MAILATQVNPRCLKIVPMDFPRPKPVVPMNVSCPKTWGWTPKSSLKHVQNPSYILDHFTNLDHFVHSVQSELSEKGLNKTLGIRHQNQVYTKVTNLGILSHFEFDWPNWPFGHSK